MMFYLVTLFQTGLLSIEARIFFNPVLSDQPYMASTALKVNRTYYVISKSSKETQDTFAIHTTTDFMEWKLEGFVFNKGNSPVWARADRLGSPYLRQVGDSFLLYFTGISWRDSRCHAGVARALHPLGPYVAAQIPFLYHPQGACVPSILEDKGKLYLMQTTGSVWLRELNPDGLGLANTNTTKILDPNYAVENEVNYPYQIRHGNYNFLAYNDGSCYGITFARSTNVFGPYDRLPNNIILAGYPYSCPRHPTIIKDLDDRLEVIIFNVINKKQWAVVMGSVGWDAQPWPFAADYGIVT